MKPFNLEQALAGKPVVTLRGDKIAHIHHMPMAQGWLRVVTVDEDGLVRLYDEHGVAPGSMESDRQLQLFMAPETVTVWMNIYDGDEAFGMNSGCIYETEEKAKRKIHIMNEYIKTVTITIEL